MPDPKNPSLRSIIAPHHLLLTPQITDLNSQDLNQLDQNFKIRIPHRFLKPEQPSLFNQVKPQLEELQIEPEESSDPIGDARHTTIAGVIHRYPQRVLLTVTHQCAMYCRFCFRKEKVSQGNHELNMDQIETALTYIQDHIEIREVIMSGGDPWILSFKKLEWILKKLNTYPHIRVVRFHTRVLSAWPERITPSFISLLKTFEKQLWCICHVNCMHEITPDFITASRALQQSAISLASQSVLLKGINDTPKQLTFLFQTLYENGIKPYYLHYPDLTKGTNHFRIPLSAAIELMRQITPFLSGLALPDFIIDIPNGWGKIRLNAFKAQHIQTIQDQEHWLFESPLHQKKIHVQYPACTETIHTK